MIENPHNYEKDIIDILQGLISRTKSVFKANSTKLDDFRVLQCVSKVVLQSIDKKTNLVYNTEILD